MDNACVILLKTPPPPHFLCPQINIIDSNEVYLCVRNNIFEVFSRYIISASILTSSEVQSVESSSAAGKLPALIYE